MAELAPVPRVPVWPLYRAMVGVGLLCGALIVGVYQWTGPVIAANRAAALQEAILEVVPDAVTSRSFAWSDAGTVAPIDGQAEGPRVHAGYDADGRLRGLALEAAGMGYQDTIRVLYGYSFERSAIIGLVVLETRETPGLGDRIETDPAFLANFEQLDVSLAAGGDSLAHPIEYTSQGAKQHPWQVDGITGATISSRAIARMLEESSTRWIPRVQAVREQFEAAGKEAS